VVVMLPYAGRHDVVYLGTGFQITDPQALGEWTQILKAAIEEAAVPDQTDGQAAPEILTTSPKPGDTIVDLTWSDNTTAEDGFVVNYSSSPYGPWVTPLGRQ